jgi:hypothetical protein
MSTLTYEAISETEKAIVYDFLNRVQEDPQFREALKKDPEIVFTTAAPRVNYASLLSPEILTALADLRRVALEEIGIDVFSYREFLVDNGNKISPPVSPSLKRAVK